MVEIDELYKFLSIVNIRKNKIDHFFSYLTLHFGSSLENYTSSKQNNTTRVQHNTRQYECNTRQHEYRTTQHEYNTA